MNAMSPPTMWVKGRCYRVTSDGAEADKLNTHQPQLAPYREEDLYEEDTQDFNVEQTASGGFRMSFHIPKIFFAIVIGAKGTTKKRIEAETKTQIKIPRPGPDVDEDIVITGARKNDLVRARNRIDLIVLSARKRQQPTHFVGVPMITPTMKESYIKFRDTMLNDPETKHVNEVLYQNPDKLHITIILLALMDNEDRVLASEVLQECKETIISPILSENDGKLLLQVRGLECMNDDPSCVNVLFAKVESQALVQIADKIADRFGKKGLMVRYNGPIKVHMTIINSKFAVLKEEKPEPTPSQPFDASKILSKYGDYDFGTITVSEIHLSQRFTYASNGFYEATAILKFD